LNNFLNFFRIAKSAAGKLFCGISERDWRELEANFSAEKFVVPQ